MKTMGLFEAKTKFSEVCDRVAETGEVCMVTRHGRPLVKIEPFSKPRKGSAILDMAEAHRRKHGPPKDDFTLPKRRVSKPRDFLD